MAAGLGFKTFTTGEVLTAADVNGYLMQGVLVFASAAARNAAITSPQEGQFAFTKDTNGLWYYDGAAWVASGATGDIEGVTAGVGITGGGTSGTVTITNDMATTITAAGDIVVGTGSGTYDNLPIGTTAQVLTADTTVSPYKVKWDTPSSGGMTLLSTTTLSGSSVTVSSISGSYTDLRIIVKAAYGSSDSDLFVRVNGDTGSNYSYYNMGISDTTAANAYSDSATSAQIGFITSSSTYDRKADIVIDMPRYTDTSNFFAIATTSVYAFSGRRQIQSFFRNNNSAAITSFTIFSSSGTFTAGTLYIYGVK